MTYFYYFIKIIYFIYKFTYLKYIAFDSLNQLETAYLINFKLNESGIPKNYDLIIEKSKHSNYKEIENKIEKILKSMVAKKFSLKNELKLVLNIKDSTFNIQIDQIKSICKNKYIFKYIIFNFNI